MTSSAKFSYEFEFNAASAEASARRLQQIYQQSLAQVKLPALTDSGAGNALVSAARAQQAQITAEASAQAGQRTAAATAEANARVAASNQATTQQIDNEQKVTQAVKAQAQERSRIGSFVREAAGALGIGLGVAGAIGLVRQGVQTALDMERQATSYRRLQVAATGLAGSQAKLNALMSAYSQATGGMVDKASSLQNVTRLMAVGFADSTEELTKFAEAVRGISVATGQNQDYVAGQLQLAIANQSTMRLDQLGLGVTEVKDRIAALRNENEALSKEEAYQIAILDIAEQKFGALLDSVEAQITGVEALTIAWANYRLEVATKVGPAVDSFAGQIAEAIDPTMPTLQTHLQAQESGGGAWLLETDAQAQTRRQLLDVINQIVAAEKAGTAVSQAYKDQVSALADEMIKYGLVSAESAAAIDNLTQNHWLAVAAAADSANATDGYATAAAAAAEDTVFLAQELADAAGEMGYLINMAASAGVGLDDLGDHADMLAQKLANVAAANAGVRQVEQNIGSAIVRQAGELAEIVGPAEAERMVREGLAQLEEKGQKWRRMGGLDPVDAAIEGSRFEDQVLGPMTDIITTHKEEQEAIDKAAKDAQRSAESSAKKTAREMEQAAEKMARDFEASLRQIPGLFGASKVTSEQMALAEGGVPQNFADDYLRRLTDEVLNGVDWADVDIADAARRAGMAEGLDPKTILAQFTAMWEDSSIFANPANLDLINMAAVDAARARQTAASQGEANILSLWGLGGEAGAAGVAGSDGAQKFFTDAGGQMTAGMMGGAQAELQNFGAQAVQTIASGMTGEEAVEQWAALGTTVGEMMVTAIETSIAGTDFVGVIVTEAVKRINEQLDQP